MCSSFPSPSNHLKTGRILSSSPFNWISQLKLSPIGNPPHLRVQSVTELDWQPQKRGSSWALNWNGGRWRTLTWRWLNAQTRAQLYTKLLLWARKRQGPRLCQVGDSLLLLYFCWPDKEWSRYSLQMTLLLLLLRQNQILVSNISNTC